MEKELFNSIMCDTWKEREARFNSLVEMYAEARKDENDAYAQKISSCTVIGRAFWEEEWAKTKINLQTLEKVFEKLEIWDDIQEKYIEIYCTDGDEEDE